MSRLPWILLARRAAYQTDIETTSAELVMGSNPVLPGDMHPDLDLSHSENLQQLVEGLKTNAAKPAQQTSAHREPPVHVPEGLDQVTHVRVRRAKPGPLGHAFEGPFKIVERQGKSCLKLRVQCERNNLGKLPSSSLQRGPSGSPASVTRQETTEPRGQINEHT